MGDECSSDNSKLEERQRVCVSGSLDGHFVEASDELFLPSDPMSLSLPDVASLDPETQERLQALLHAAGITRAAQEGKMFADPEILRRLTSSVSCALDEAADALTRMKSSSSESECAHATTPQLPKEQLISSCAVAQAQAAANDGNAWTVPNTGGVVEEGESLLSLACSAGYYELAQVLLAMRTNVEDRGAKGDCTPLMEAASAGHNDIVKLLVDNGADVNAQSSSGNTPLMYACAGGHKDVVQSLVSANADVEQKNENGHSPLMEAASAGHVDIATLLVDNLAAIQSQNTEFKVGLESPLTLACYKGHIDMVRFLLQVGPKAAQRQEELHTALMEASMDGHLEVARLLLEHGAPVNLPSDSFESPLTLAACGGHLDLVRLLLDRGAQIEDPNDEGYTPLMEAAREGHEDVVQLLLDRGADINAQTDETGETALTLAACGGFRDVVQLLVDRGADLDLGANSPLMEAAHEGHIDTVKYLISAIKSLNDDTVTIDAATPATGDTALTYAAENGHTDVCQALVEANANVEHEADGGRTSIMKAARNGHVCTVEYLLKKGANPRKHTSANDHTALSLACANGHAQVVQHLLHSGADVSQTLKDGSNCILEASRNGHTNVVQILLDWPATLASRKQTARRSQPLRHPPVVKKVDKPLVVPVVPEDKPAENVPATPPTSPTNSPAASAFNLAVDPQFLASLQQHQGGTSPQPGSSPNSPMSLPIAMTPDQREWLLQQAQKALIKQAGEKLSTHDLQQLNDVLKQQFRQLFPTLPGSPVIPKRKASSGSQSGAPAVSQPAQPTQPKDAETVKREYDMLKKLQTAAQKVVNSAQEHQAQLQNTPNDAGTQTTLTLQGAIQLQTNEDVPAQHAVNFQVPPPPAQVAQPTPMYATPNNAAAAYDAASALPKENGVVPPACATRKPLAALDLNHATDSNHDTALTLACAGGHEELVQLLLQRGASLEHRDKKGFTPLILAATAGHWVVVETLLAQNANIEAQSERTKDTALSLACSGGRKEVVELLLKRGANKEHRNVSDYTPLSLAASGGYVEIIQLLLNYGAEINSRTGSKLGISPLMLAAMNGHTQAVKLLLERGSDINAQIETNRNTALTLACFQGRHEVVKLLLEYKANFEHRAKTGLTPLMEAASGGYVEVGRVLLHCGADPNAAPVPSSRDTALTIAADKGHHKFVELLMQHHAQVDARNKKGCTSLWLASHGGHLDTVQVLVKYHADVDAQDNRKVTPVMAAFKKGHVKVVKWLVRAVTQFPSDQECQRFITTIADKDLTVKCRQCMEVLVAAKDRQAAEANRAAATLLFELEQEEKVAANKRQAKQRQKEKKKAKKAAKKKENKPEEEEEGKDVSEKGGSISGSPPPPTPAPRAVQEDLDEDEDTEDDVPAQRITPQPSPPSPVKVKVKSPVNEPSDDRVPSTPVTPDEPNPPNSRKKLDEDGRQYATRQRYVNRRRTTHPNRHTDESYTVYNSRTNNNSLNAQDRHNGSQISPSASSRQYNNVNNNSDIEWCKAGKSKSTNSVSKTKGGDGKSKTDKNMVHPEDPHTPVAGWREVRRKANKLFVSSTAIARVIGRGGQNINAIREATGAHIEVEKQQPRKEQNDRLITIRGSTDATKMAVLMINGLIQEPEAPVLDIVKKVKDRDEEAIEAFTPTSANSTSTSDSMTLGKNICPPIQSTTDLPTMNTMQSNGKRFPQVSVWMNSGKSEPSLTTTAAGQAAPLLVTASSMHQGSQPSTDYSPFNTPTLNVWQQRAMMRHDAHSPGGHEQRKDFASVTKQGVSSTGLTNPPARPQSPCDNAVNIVDQTKAPGYRGNVSRAATASSGASDEGFSPPGLSVHSGSQSAMDYYQSPTNVHSNFSASKSAFTSPATGLGMLGRELEPFTHHALNRDSPPPCDSTFFAPITLPTNRPASATPALGIDTQMHSPHSPFSRNNMRSTDNLTSPHNRDKVNKINDLPLNVNMAIPPVNYGPGGDAPSLSQQVQSQAHEQMQQLMQHAGRLANMNMGSDWGVVPPPASHHQLGSLANDIAHLRMDAPPNLPPPVSAPRNNTTSLLGEMWSQHQHKPQPTQQHSFDHIHNHAGIGASQSTPYDLLQEMMGASGDHMAPHKFTGIDDNVLKTAAASLIRNMVNQQPQSDYNVTTPSHMLHPPPPIGMPPPSHNPWAYQQHYGQQQFGVPGNYSMPPPKVAPVGPPPPVRPPASSQPSSQWSGGWSGMV